MSDETIGERVAKEVFDLLGRDTRFHHPDEGRIAALVDREVEALQVQHDRHQVDKANLLTENDRLRAQNAELSNGQQWLGEVIKQVREERDMLREAVDVYKAEAVHWAEEHTRIAELVAMLERVCGSLVNINGDTKLSEDARDLLAKHRGERKI
jgi:hypothetical protein